MKPRPKFERASLHVRLYHWLLDTPAWQSLSPNARAIYLEVARRYNGSNNGRLPLSVREVVISLHIGKNAAAAGFLQLQERGFLAATRKGAFAVKNRKSTEWRLTEFKCDVTDELATKDFTRWHVKIQNTVPPQVPTVPVRGPYSPRLRTVAR